MLFKHESFIFNNTLFICPHLSAFIFAFSYSKKLKER